MSLDEYKIVAPLTYGGKEGCTSGRCRSMPDGEGGWICVGWHCSYCDEPTSYQGHNCDAADAIVGEAKRLAALGFQEGTDHE